MFSFWLCCPLWLIFLVNPQCSWCAVEFSSNIEFSIQNSSINPNSSSVILDVDVDGEKINFKVVVNLKKDEFQKKHNIMKKLYIGIGTEDLSSTIDIIGICIESHKNYNSTTCQNSPNGCIIQDGHWNKETETYILDSIQNYGLHQFETRDNSSIIEINFSREIFTGDSEDFQLTTKRDMTLFWALKEVLTTETVLNESDIKKITSVAPQKPTSTTKSPKNVGIKDNKSSGIDLAEEKFFHKFQQPPSPGTNITLHSLLAFGFQEAITATFDRMLLSAGSLLLKIFDMESGIYDVYKYFCTIDEYLYIRSFGIQDNLYIANVKNNSGNNGTDDYGPNVIPKCVISVNGNASTKDAPGSENITLQANGNGAGAGGRVNVYSFFALFFTGRITFFYFTS